MSQPDQELLAATDALRKGNARAARDGFARVLAAGRGDVSSLLGMAAACRALGDHDGVISATQSLLAKEPRNLHALIFTGDAYSARGDSRTATSFYLAALKSAPPAAQLPQELIRELRRVRDACDQASAHYRDYILDQMQKRGFDPATSSPRFAQSLDIVLGRKRIYVQEPFYYYFAGLPQIQFYDNAAFDWVAGIEAQTDAIQAELLGVLDVPGAFAPYVTGASNRPVNGQAGMLNNPDWSAFYLWKNGERVEENAARFPQTMRALENIPLAFVPGRSPSVLFSLLRPGTHIPPHHGMVNTRLICHLPIIVPGPCRFRVGNETRHWTRGKCWLFDDTIEHEAWNDTDQARVILLFDVWKPELSQEERELVISLFEAIDAHDGKRPDWSI